MTYIKEELESMLIEHPKNEAKLTEIDLKLEGVWKGLQMLK